MKNFIIMTDSGCDLTQRMVEDLGILVAPMCLNLHNHSYRHYPDFRELSKEDFYATIRKGESGQTAGANPADIEDMMLAKVEEGYNILYLSFSSGMSGSYNNACIAAREVLSQHPEARIEVIDTLSGSVGLGMLNCLAVYKQRSGANFDETLEYIQNIKLKICHYFMVDDLKFIGKTGRISHLKATVGTMLGVKPVFKLDDNGKVADDTKVRGKKAGIQHMLNRVKEKCSDLSTFFVCHADVEDEAIAIKEKLHIMFPGAQVFVNCLGPILGNNTGPGTLGIIFCGDAR